METVPRVHFMFGREHAPNESAVQRLMRNPKKPAPSRTISRSSVILAAEPSATLSQGVKVLMIAQEHRLVIVRNNRTFQEALDANFRERSASAYFNVQLAQVKTNTSFVVSMICQLGVAKARCGR